jgi:hypothetical protein
MSRLQHIEPARCRHHREVIAGKSRKLAGNALWRNDFRAGIHKWRSVYQDRETHQSRAAVLLPRGPDATNHLRTLAAGSFERLGGPPGSARSQVVPFPDRLSPQLLS